jgi:transcriptional regulator with XRE-family HTH domain
MQVKITITVDIPGLDQEIKTAMEEQNVSYGALSKKVGVTASTCWQIAKGESKATKLETVWKIAKALDIGMSERFKQALVEQTPIWGNTDER